MPSAHHGYQHPEYNVPNQIDILLDEHVVTPIQPFGFRTYLACQKESGIFRKEVHRTSEEFDETLAGFYVLTASYATIQENTRTIAKTRDDLNRRHFYLLS